ncbi:DUF922 domain-containing protein [Chryseobacterium sp.]|uniref:DUF922 domain-containing protein n=1 Tax=Chryseobacterium sp. TaxID=1871047 RepID=UPI0011CC20CF|nr:DUF922 domain-containing protein [Chryseobacterium sp.]TXF77177.1 DUF922 domain-containing protein [Chryseobacterium sp.]
MTKSKPYQYCLKFKYFSSVKFRTMVFFLVMISATLCAQEIKINGIQRDGKLRWDDFPEKDDPNFSFDAYIKYYYTFNIPRFKLKNNVFVPAEVVGTLQFNQNESWVRPGKQNDELLTHEQGHFNIGILTIREIMKELKSMRFQPHEKNPKSIFDGIVQKIKNKYNEMEKNYDLETNHSLDKENQEKWNSFFRKQLPELCDKPQKD